MDTKKLSISELEKKMDKISFSIFSNRTGQSYNYSKIVENIEKLNKLLELHLTELEIKGLKSKPSEFIEEKTTSKSFNGRLKKTIRRKKRNLQDNYKVENNPDKKTFYGELITLVSYYGVGDE